VLEPGVIRAGDPVTLDRRPDHDVSIGVLVTGMTPAQARRLLDADVSLTPGVCAKARRHAVASAG
jgi:MOSC domain-containing protein YiiM